MYCGDDAVYVDYKRPNCP